MPTTLRLIGNVREKKILDLGCGPGLYANVLKRKGARVKGIDNSKKFIEIAGKEVPNIDFVLGDISKKLPYKNNEFDIVLSALVLGHLASWDNVLKEVRRVLKKNGLFVFSIKNPIIQCERKIKWKGRRFRVIKDYFKEGWRTADWAVHGKKFKSVLIAHHHKKYSTIIRNLVKNGFEIVDYEDTKPLAKAKKIFPKQYNKTINRPHFCVWKVKKRYLL